MLQTRVIHLAPVRNECKSGVEQRRMHFSRPILISKRGRTMTPASLVCSPANTHTHAHTFDHISCSGQLFYCTSALTFCRAVHTHTHTLQRKNCIIKSISPLPRASVKHNSVCDCTQSFYSCSHHFNTLGVAMNTLLKSKCEYYAALPTNFSPLLCSAHLSTIS